MTFPMSRLAALRKQFTERGGMSWTGKRLRDRISDVRDQWPEGDPSLNLFADMPNKLDNLWLHPSPFALKAAFQIEDGKTNLTYGKGPNSYDALF